MPAESPSAADLQPVEAIHTEPGAQCPAVRITTPARLLNLVSYALGFHPDNCMVVTGKRGNGEPGVTLRLPPHDPADPGLTTTLANRVVAILTAQQYSKAVVVGYGPEDRVTPFAGRFRDLAVMQGIEVQEILRVQDGRFWSYVCTDPACCPADGTPYSLGEDPDLVSGLPVGSSGVLPSREDLVAQVAPVTGAEATAMRQATTRAEERHLQLLDYEPASADEPAGTALLIAEGIKAGQAAIQRFQEGGDISPDEAAWLTLCLHSTQVRDDFWSRLEPEGRTQNLRLLLKLTRLTQLPYVTPAATLLAFVAWQCGNGALANIALDRALDDGRKYSMAEMIREAVNAGASPELAKLPMTPEEVAAVYKERAPQEARRPARPHTATAEGSSS
jgi:Domain of unknown function (DUF4192)